jgi:H+/Cl- antiporter ClcA
VKIGRRIFEIVILGICLALYQSFFYEMWMRLFPSKGIFEMTIGYILVGLIALFVSNSIIWSLKRTEGERGGES